MNHLDPALLSAHLDGALTGKAREGVDRHLAECGDCRAAYAELAAQDLALKPALQHDPGDAYFETFAARVEDRIRAAGLSGVQARTDGGRGFDLGIWFRSPRRIAALGVAAAVIAGAGIVLITARETPPGLRESELDRRIGQQAGEESTAPSLGAEAPPSPTGSADESQKKQQPETKRLADRTNAARRAPLGGARNEGLAALTHPKASPEEVPAKRHDVDASPDDLRKATEAEAREVVKSKASGASKELATRDRAPSTPGFSRSPATPPAASNAAGAREEQDAAADQALSKVEESTMTVGGRVRGRVVDLTGRPIVGAQVTFPAKGRSVATGGDGRFVIDVPPGEHTVSVMAVGFGTQQQQVLVGPESSDLLVALRPVMVLGTDGMAFRNTAPSEPSPALVGGLKGGETLDVRADSLERVVALAEAEQRRAAAARAPVLYDAAALQWQRALPLAIGTPREAQVRFKLAEARFRAWQVGKTQRRAAIAEETLTAFLVRARMGADRDTAARWLDQIKR